MRRDTLPDAIAPNKSVRPQHLAIEVGHLAIFR